jgi:uncharacterized protein (TIGR02680 family)
MMNRWKMHKLGFVNFWLYDHEEFPVEDGHILLRGENASGKSITTQSFIPFLLDGNKSPERLDPFGSKDRKMEYYLLGDGDKEEATGYLYLEFKKENLEEYCTIGVGMRAKSGKPMGFWGFCLCDGRRIGPEGLSLYKKLGDQLIPLSRIELRNQIADDDNWAESPSTYKQLVNTRVFQFRDLRQYEQLIQLLIKVRTPKLSKDAFRPTAVKKSLNDSLQVLTDEDLSAMVSTMERMDELESTLESQRLAMRNAQIIQREYTRYNQYMLGKKAKAYLDARQNLTKGQADLESGQEAYADARDHLAQATQDQQDAVLQMRSLQAQLMELGEDDLAVQQNRLEEEQANCRRYQDQLAQGTKQFTALQSRIADLRQRICQREEERSALWAQVEEHCQVLNRQNQSLLLEEEHSQYLQALPNAQAAVDPKPLQTALQRRKKLLHEILRLLEQLEQNRVSYEEACEALDEATTAVRQAQIVLRDAQLQEQQERDVLLENTTRSLSENREFRLTPEDLIALKQRLSRYRTPADWTEVALLLDTSYRGLQGKLQDKRSRGEVALEEQKKKYNDARRELRELQNQPEPIPPRRGSIQATRSMLTMSGIPHAALYEVVDFAPELDVPARNLLEAQLMDAGLLDALVVPQEYQLEIQSFLEQYPDQFISPEPPVKDPITCLVPDVAQPFRPMVEAFLQGISRSDWESGTALLPDGRFRCGPIRGFSHDEAPAGYVGATARRINREQQLRRLEEKLKQAQAQMEQKQQELDALSARLALLEKERNETPTAADLDQALEMLAQAKLSLTKAEEVQTQRQKKEQSAKQVVVRLEQEINQTSLGLSYTRTTEQYRALCETAEQYQATLSDLTISHNSWINGWKIIEAIQSDLSGTEARAQVQQQHNQDLSQQLEVGRSRIQAIEEILNSPENRAQAQRRADLKHALSVQQQRKENAARTCATQEERLHNLADILARQQEILAQLKQRTAAARDYFQEECSLGLPNCAEGTLDSRAQAAYQALRQEDRDRSDAKLNDALTKNYQEHKDTLLAYQPKIEMVFEDAAYPDLLRPRFTITLKKDGKELSLYAFLQALQQDIDTCTVLMEEKDRDLFENILTETISHKLRARIEESQQWTENMTKLMRGLNTSMGLTFRLDWKPKAAQGEEELDTAKLVTLLNKDRALVTREDNQRVSVHFRTRVKKARSEALLEDRSVGYADLIREVLDYRNWYEFHLLYQRDGEGARELTDRAFNKFSGGEKAMAMYVPLFAAVSAQYQKCSPQCPRLIALDEAFAGVDERNINAMFHLVETLDFDYIMNSQALWGCYTDVTSLDIAELHRPLNASVVTILRYHWNGTRRTQEEL